MREDSSRKSKKYLPDVRLCVTGASNVGKSGKIVNLYFAQYLYEVLSLVTLWLF